MFRAFTLDCMASLIFTHIWHHLLPCWDWVWEWGFLGWRAAGRCSGWRAVRDHPQSKQGRGWVSGEKHQQKNARRCNDSRWDAAMTAMWRVMQDRWEHMKTLWPAHVTQLTQWHTAWSLQEPFRHPHNELHCLFPVCFSSTLSYAIAQSDKRGCKGFVSHEKVARSCCLSAHRVNPPKLWIPQGQTRSWLMMLKAGQELREAFTPGGDLETEVDAGETEGWARWIYSSQLQ